VQEPRDSARRRRRLRSESALRRRSGEAGRSR